MRLLILTQYFYPEIGAPQSRLYDLSQSLLASGEDVRVLTAMPNYPTGKIFKKYRFKFYKTEKLGALRIDRFPIWPSNSKKALPRILSMLSFSISALLALPMILLWRPDFILVESPPLLLGLSGYVISRISRAKFIFNVSDLWPLSAAELGALSKESFIYRMLEKLEAFLYKKSTLVLGQSGQIVEHVEKMKLTKSHLFRNGVDLNRFQNPRLKIAESQRLRIVYAGLLGVAQGLLAISREINFLELGAELHIYGDGPEYLAIQKWIEAHPHRGIRLNVPLSRDLIPQKLSEFDCALVPLVRNIFGAVPSKIYEAMAAGLPILFSGDGEGADIVRSYQVGWVSAAGNYEELKKNILLAMANREQRQDFIENSRHSAENFFSRDFQINQLKDVLQKELSL